MKKQSFWLVLLFLICLSIPLTATAQIVDIPDPNLRVAIEKHLGIVPGATITVVGMETLTTLFTHGTNISDLTGLEHATNLTRLSFASNSISDISPLAELTKLTELDLPYNSISDISALTGLTQLTRLHLRGNAISDISALTGLTNLENLWLEENSISDLSPLVENTGLGHGDLVEVGGNFLNALSINTHIPTLQSRGVTVGFDNIIVQPEDINQIVDIPDPALRAAINALRGKAPDATISVADMLTLIIFIAPNGNLSDLTGLEHATNLIWLDLNIVFLAEDFINNSVSDLSPLAGLTNLTHLWLGDNSISDISPLVENTGLGNEDFVDVTGNPLSAPSINTHIPTLQSRGVMIEFDDIVAQPADVDGDGVVNIFDLVSVGAQFGKRGKNLAADVNRDGIVDVRDLVLVAGMFGEVAAAPSVHPQAAEMLTAAAVRGWLTDAKALEINDSIIERGVVVLQQLLISLTPTETKLLPNYPNPFNPETWIPYRLADDAFVTLTIYDLNGQVICTIDVGHQTAAFYESRSQAIHWDGRNQIGEQVASGVYFYHLSAGDYSATRKMLILK